MHVGNGHINHFIHNMLNVSRRWRKDNCDWQRQVASFITDLSEWRVEFADSRPLVDSDQELKSKVSTLRERVTRACTALKKLDSIDFPVAREVELIERAMEDLKTKEEELEEAKEERRANARSSMGGNGT